MGARRRGGDNSRRRRATGGATPSGRSEAEQLSSLIGAVYDAALDRSRWFDAVEQTNRFLNCYGTVLGAYDFLQGTYNLGFQSGYPKDYWDSYLNHYFHLNPFNRPAFRTAIGEIWRGPKEPVWEEYLASDFYREWTQPQGIVDAIQGTLDKSASGIALLTCTRHESVGLITDAEVRRMGLILPHFRRAFLIGKLLDLHDVRAAAFAEAIDRLSTGVFLITAQGNLVHANAAGQDMLDDEDPVRMSRGFLVSSDEGNEPLREALTAAFANAAVAAGNVAVAITGRAGEHFTAHILPLNSGIRLQAAADLAASAVLFIRKAEIDLPSAINAATQLYGFTPAEARVLAALIEVGGIGPVASMLGVARRTVQTHLEHLFEKTGTRRQADLVKLIAGYDSPVRAGVD